MFAGETRETESPPGGLGWGSVLVEWCLKVERSPPTGFPTGGSGGHKSGLSNVLSAKYSFFE